MRVHDVEHDWGLPSTHSITSTALGGFVWYYAWEHRHAWHLSTNWLVGLGAAILVRGSAHRTRR